MHSMKQTQTYSFGPVNAATRSLSCEKETRPQDAERKIQVGRRSRQVHTASGTLIRWAPEIT